MGTLKKKVNKYILLSPLHCRPFQVFESLKTAVHTYTPTKKEGLWKKNVHSFSKLLPDPPGTTWCTVHRRRSPHETKMTRRRKASLQRQDIPFFFFYHSSICFALGVSNPTNSKWLEEVLGSTPQHKHSEVSLICRRTHSSTTLQELCLCKSSLPANPSLLTPWLICYTYFTNVLPRR